MKTVINPAVLSPEVIPASKMKANTLYKTVHYIANDEVKINEHCGKIVVRVNNVMVVVGDFTSYWSNPGNPYFVEEMPKGTSVTITQE